MRRFGRLCGGRSAPVGSVVTNPMPENAAAAAILWAERRGVPANRQTSGDHGDWVRVTPRYSVPPSERSRFAVGVCPWLATQAA